MVFTIEYCLIFSPDYNGKPFEIENLIFFETKKRPTEALFVYKKMV
jgi:hypothetical protein